MTQARKGPRLPLSRQDEAILAGPWLSTQLASMNAISVNRCGNWQLVVRTGMSDAESCATTLWQWQTLIARRQRKNESFR